MDSSEKSMRSLKAYLLPKLCPSTMCASSCDSTMAKLASSGRTSISPRLTTMVLPTLKVSRGDVSITRVRTGRGNSRLLVISRLFTTVCRILSTSLSGASKPAFCKRSMTLSSACCCHCRCACRGEESCAAGLSSFTESTNIWVSSVSLPTFCRSYPQRRVWALKAILSLEPWLKSPSSL